jgi:hypothetical protein
MKLKDKLFNFTNKHSSKMAVLSPSFLILLSANKQHTGLYVKKWKLVLLTISSVSFMYPSHRRALESVMRVNQGWV